MFRVSQLAAFSSYATHRQRRQRLESNTEQTEHRDAFRYSLLVLKLYSIHYMRYRFSVLAGYRNIGIFTVQVYAFHKRHRSCYLLIIRGSA